MNKSITEIFKNHKLNNWDDWRFKDSSDYFPFFYIWLDGCSFSLEKELIFGTLKDKKFPKIKTHVFHLNFSFTGEISVQKFYIHEKHEDWKLINSLYEYFHAKYLIYTNKFLIINQDLIFSENDLKEINEIVL